MVRSPKPWYRKSRKCWFVMLDGKQHNLGPDRKAAFDQFYRLMLSSQETKAAPETFASLADRLLDWVQRKRSPPNAATQADRCQHTQQCRTESGDLLGSWIEVHTESEMIISCRSCGINFQKFFKEVQAEMLRAYREQQSRLACPGCGEEPFLG